MTAKFSYSLTERMFGHAIEQGWLKKGQVVVDPFGGVGCGGIVAAYADIQWISCELEQKFVDLARENFELHRRKWEGLGCPQPVIIQGDSREMCTVLGAADCVVSSPPFLGSQEGASVAGPSSGMWKGYEKGLKAGNGSKTYESSQRAYGQTPGQLGGMKPGQLADAIVSSPPYAESLQPGGDGIDWSKIKEGGTNRTDARKAIGEGYGSNRRNLGNLKPGAVDAVVSSPPYEGNPNAGESKKGFKYTGKHNYTGKRCSINRYDTDKVKSNLGNQQGPTFWQAAKEIVQQCHQILKPGGHAIWVVKAFVRKGKRVDFPGDWRRLCESVGFVTVCTHHAMLVKETIDNGLFGEIAVKKERKSFFRHLAESKGSPAIDFEVILCMEK